MEETIYINLYPNLNAALTANVQLCPTWEVVTTEELSLPLPWNTEPKQGPSTQEVLDAEKQNVESFLYKKKNCCRIPSKSKKCSIKEKELGPDCKCPSKCFKKIGEETICKIFNDFWALSDYNSQNAYLFGLINLVRVKRRCKSKMSKWNFTVVYHVKDKGQNVLVCKKAFLNICGLQRNRGRINNLTNKMKEGESIPPPYNRVIAPADQMLTARKPLSMFGDTCFSVQRWIRKRVQVSFQNMVFSTKWCYAF